MARRGSLPVLLVDGYNLLRSSGRYDDIETDDFDDDPLNRAREALISDIAAFAQGRYDATIVFDGGGNIMSEGIPAKTAGIQVVFSAAGTDADQLIERLAFKARSAGREVVVISSDWAVQNATFHDGVTRMSAVGFTHEIAAVDEGLAEKAHSTGKMTVGSRLDEDTRGKLERLLHELSGD